MALYDFLNRRNTYSNWMNDNIVLPDGVLGVITDSPDDELWLLMGDGVTHVKDLKIWKLYQDTVRESQPATLSQLTLKSDGVHDPLTVQDTNGNMQVDIGPDGSLVALLVNYLHGQDNNGEMDGFGLVTGDESHGLALQNTIRVQPIGDAGGVIYWNDGNVEITGPMMVDGDTTINGDTTIYGETTGAGRYVAYTPSSIAISSGATSERPEYDDPDVCVLQGYPYFDTDLGKPIWVKSVDTSATPPTVTWVDSTGAVV